MTMLLQNAFRVTSFAMKVLVTGASGFIGGAVVRALVKAGTEVRVIARHGSDTRHLTGLPAEQVEGDLRNRGSGYAGAPGLPTALPCGGALCALGQRSRDLL